MQKLTLEFEEPPKLPLPAESRLDCAIGVTGSDDVLFILGVNIFVSDSDLDIKGLSLGVAHEVSAAWLAAFSTSKLVFRYLKFSFGKKPFMDDLALDDEGPGEPFFLASAEQGVKLKFTLLGVGVGLGVGGILTMTESCEETASVLEGISKKRFLRFQCCKLLVSSVIPIGSSA